MIDWLITILTPYASTVPLEALVFCFSFLEEIIAPIPAFPILLLTGGFAVVQNYGLLGILWLAAVAAFGKTLGAIIVYHIVDKVENVFMTRFGAYFDVAPGDLEKFGSRLGHGKRDYVFLTLARAIPFIPSAIISVGSGLIHIPLKLYIVATFVGSFFRILSYLLAGYFGAEVVIHYLSGSEALSSVVQWVVLLLAGCGFLYLLWRRRTK